MTDSTTLKPHLLNLPPELRLITYSFLRPRKVARRMLVKPHVDVFWIDYTHRIAETCKLLRNEYEDYIGKQTVRKAPIIEVRASPDDGDDGDDGISDWKCVPFVCKALRMAIFAVQRHPSYAPRDDPDLVKLDDTEIEVAVRNAMLEFSQDFRPNKFETVTQFCRKAMIQLLYSDYIKIKSRVGNLGKELRAVGKQENLEIVSMASELNGGRYTKPFRIKYCT